MSHLNSGKLPLGSALYTMTRQFAGLFTEKLKHLAIDRYYTILLIVHYSGNSISQQKIADQLKIDKASMVRMIDFLTSRELLEKKVNLENRREYKIILTQKAKKMIPEIERAASEVNKILFKKVNSEEKRIFLKVLNQVTEDREDISLLNSTLIIKHGKK